MSESIRLNDVVAWPGVGEMCRYLGISLNRGYSLVWSGRLAAQKIGGQWRVSPKAIEKYAQERKSRGKHLKHLSIVTSIADAILKGQQ